MLSKQLVLDHFGSPQEVARFLGVTDKAVYQWPDPIPRECELELKLRKPEIFGRDVPPRFRVRGMAA